MSVAQHRVIRTVQARMKQLMHQDTHDLVIIFCLFREKFRDRTTNGKALIAISGCMLGVYVVHPLFIKASYGLGFTPVDPNPLITSPIMAVIFFTLSLGVVFAARQIPGLKKIL